MPAPIEIPNNLCNLCQACLKKCPFGALEIKDGKIYVNEKCTGCGICVKACPTKAITIVDTETGQQVWPQ